MFAVIKSLIKNEPGRLKWMILTGNPRERGGVAISNQKVGVIMNGNLVRMEKKLPYWPRTCFWRGCGFYALLRSSEIFRKQDLNWTRGPGPPPAGQLRVSGFHSRTLLYLVATR